jgi:class 3 adenylate cyclase/tetratricopeptide (TPR) repeat protein
MRCSNCGSDNPAGKKFCSECGAGFSRGCPQCGAENAPAAKFCGDCGAELSPPVQPPVPEASPVQLREVAGERRHLTVLFCDLVGSTGIAAQLDPEEWRDTVAGYQRTAAEAITRFGGHVAKYLGDGVMAFFGYPEAHDDETERATRAGLAIIDDIAKLNEQPGRTKLSARVGIHSGAVVVGVGAGKDADVFGDAPNIAARVQEAATPGTVLVTEATHQLVLGLFAVESRGAPALKGIERSLQLYRVIQPSGVRGRLEAAATGRGLTPFIGREDELRLLMNRWERVLDGEGQVALIIGEAGIGKSRLVQRFHEQIAATPHTWVETATGAFFQNTPFYPVAEMLKQALACRGDEPAEQQLTQLESVLELAGLKHAEAIPLLAPLLNLPPSAKYPPSALSPEQQRRRLLAKLVELALGLARVQPTVITTEDLHWADPSTLELIQLLVEQGAQARLLLLYTARPEFRAQWPPRAHHAQITLNRLSTRRVREMITQVAQVAARKALADETVNAVVERTSGVPLFVEELTRAVLESGTTKLRPREIPITLHDSLMARLDRLGPARDVLQIGAVIGSEFSYELLEAVHPIAEQDLQHALRSAADAQLIYVRGIAPQATYQFKHALIRDAAYEALLRSRRRELHALVACTINEKFAALKETHPEVLARHWTEASETDQAIAEWTRAGKAAEARNAFREALESYHHALTLVDLLPESAQRDGRELDLMQSVVTMLQMTRGYAADETREATERATALAERSGNLSQLVDWISRRSSAAFVSGDLPAADALDAKALQLALREGSAAGQGRVYAHQMQIRFMRGDLAGAEKQFITGSKFFSDHGFKRAPGAAVSAFGWASWNAWTLGRFDIARERMARMLAVANPNNPYDLAFSRTFAGLIHVCRKEYGQAETSAASALELSEKNQFPYLAGVSQCILGQAHAQLGCASDGIALIRQGIVRMLAVGSRVTLGNLRLAEAQKCAGAISEALDTVEQALQAAPEGELVHQPEMLRLRGELRLTQGQTEIAEADFRESIRFARCMSAKAWELRVVMSLARLLRDTSRRDEARAMLAEIYGWFTEGFDTADLKDANALLDELSR